jgi:putative phosphoribosyl transferase
MHRGSTAYATFAGEQHALAEETSISTPHELGVLNGSLAVPPSPRGIVLIANDAGSARFVSPLRTLAHQLHLAGLGTLIVDVLELDEQKVGVTTMAKRVGSARNWLTNGDLGKSPLVLFGLGQAAPAVLLSVAARPTHVDAVIACGPSPDRAGLALDYVGVPTLLIAHSGARGDVDANRRTLALLHGERDMVVLHEPADPFKAALDIARATLIFLARESCHLRKAV